MSAVILDGKILSEIVMKEISTRVRKFVKKPELAVVLVGDNPASQVYVGKKHEACAKVGIISRRYDLAGTTSENELLTLIETLNHDRAVSGILVQMPLPSHIDSSLILSRIDPTKDVDGLTPQACGFLYSGNSLVVPCTAKGVLRLLDQYHIAMEGKQVVIINRSAIVGKPLMHLFLERNSTVTVCHSKTVDVSSFTKKADIVVSAVGKKGFLTGSMIKKGSVIVDVGISREGKKIVGDVDIASVKKKAGYLSPVPGGVGPMTIATLLQNTLIASEKT